MQFSSILEHSLPKKRLIQTTEINKLAHAHLFIGEPGSAALPLALAFATYVNCLEPTRDDSCARCASCANMKNMSHPDFHFLLPRSKKSEDLEIQWITSFLNCIKNHPFLTLEDWEAFAQFKGKQSQIFSQSVDQMVYQIKLKPFMASYKVVLIWLPELLTHTAANALLKTLEDPPKGTIFLLVTAAYMQVLSTIVSRTQHHHVGLFSTTGIKQLLLAKNQNLCNDQLDMLASLSYGNGYKALQLIEQQETYIRYFDQFKDWMRCCYKTNFKGLVQKSDHFSKLTTNEQKSFLNYSLEMVRSTLFTKTSSLTTVLPMESSFIKKFGQTVTLAQLKTMAQLFNQAYIYLTRSAHSKITYMKTSIDLCKLFET